MSSNEPFNLQRFVDAQEPVFDKALSELKAGKKLTHWMWYVFPQMRGLGRSPTASFYALSSLEEAEAYLNHPILGQRLIESTGAVLLNKESSLESIFGVPDNYKFQSCMTLFAQATNNPAVFLQALETFCGNQLDKQTLVLIQRVK